MRQYEICRGRLPEPAGQRPVLLLSRDNAYEYRSKFTAAEITPMIRQIANEIPPGEDEGLQKVSAANWIDGVRWGTGGDYGSWVLIFSDFQNSPARTGRGAFSLNFALQPSVFWPVECRALR